MCRERERERFIIRNWFMELKRLTSPIPSVGKLEARAQAESVVQFQSKHSNMRTGRTDVTIPAMPNSLKMKEKLMFLFKSKGKKKSCPSLAVRQKESLLLNHFVLFRPSMDQTRLTLSYPDQVTLSDLFCLLTQMLISSRNTFTDTVRIIFDQISEYLIA